MVLAVGGRIRKVADSIQRVMHVARINSLISRRQFQTAMSVGDAGGRALQILTIIILGGFALLLTILTFDTLAGATLPPEMVQAIAASNASSVMLMAGIGALVVQVLQPRDEEMRSLLEMLPVSRFETELGLHGPVLKTGMLLGLLLATPSLVLQIRSNPTPLHVFATVVGIVTSLLMVNLLVRCALELTSRVYGALVTNSVVLSNALGGYTVFAALIVWLGPTVLSDGLTTSSAVSELHILRPEGLLARVFVETELGQALLYILLLAMWLVCVTALLHFVSGIRSGESLRRQPTLGRLRTLMPQSQLAGLSWVQTLLTWRSPVLRLTILFSPALAVLALLAKGRGLGEMAYEAIALASVNVGFIISGQTSGRSLPFRWIDRHIRGSGRLWEYVSVVVALVCHVLMAALAIAWVYLAVGWVDAFDSHLIMVGMVGWGIGLVVGAFLPYDERSPALFTSSVVLGLGSVFALTQLLHYAGETSMSALFLTFWAEMIALVALWLVATGRLDRRVVSHAY